MRFNYGQKINEKAQAKASARINDIKKADRVQSAEISIGRQQLLNDALGSIGGNGAVQAPVPQAQSRGYGRTQ